MLRRFFHASRHRQPRCLETSDGRGEVRGGLRGGPRVVFRGTNVARRRVGLGVSLCLGLLGAWMGCSIYDGSLLLDAPDANSPDGNLTDALVEGPLGDGAVEDPCSHARPPERPAPSPTASSQGSLPAFAVALRRVSLGLTPEDGGLPSASGLDLDTTCTGQFDAGPSCKTKAPWQDTLALDEGPRGEDRSGNRLVDDLRKRVAGDSVSDNRINEKLANGTIGSLVEIADYNGQPDDDRVTVRVYPSNGTESDAGATWDGGNDLWTVSRDSYVNPDAPATERIEAYADANAYVRNGSLVATLDFPLRLGRTQDAKFPDVELSGARVVARLQRVRDDSFALVDGLIAGRWPALKLLRSLAVYNLGSSAATRLCPGTLPYESFARPMVCGALDIAVHPTTGSANDVDNAGVDCNAVAVAFAFEAFPAKKGRLDPKPIEVISCGDASYSCP